MKNFSLKVFLMVMCGLNGQLNAQDYAESRSSELQRSGQETEVTRAERDFARRKKEVEIQQQIEQLQQDSTCPKKRALLADRKTLLVTIQKEHEELKIGDENDARYKQEDLACKRVKTELEEWKARKELNALKENDFTAWVWTMFTHGACFGGGVLLCVLLRNN